VNDHASESHALNLVNAPRPLNICNASLGSYPYTYHVRPGATVKGYVTDGRTNLQVDGVAGGYAFRVKFSGSR
jgi:hypothetical protein